MAFFADNRDYNLIFAPHVVLFKRRWRHGARLPKGYDGCANILIDTGGLASTDMTYMRAADIYLGDASSQAYEFLLDPRSCIFLNAHDVDWRNDPDYPHFSFGQVVDDARRGVGPALEVAISGHGAFKRLQEDAISYTFKRESDSTAAERGAIALARFLHLDADNESHDPNSEGLGTEKPALAIGS
jgi:hypothetical protein